MQRIGMCTASRVKDVMKRLQRASGGRKKGDYAQPHYNYLKELVIERLTGRAQDHNIGSLQAVEWGIENEPVARGYYEIATDQKCTPIGFAMHPSIEWFGASPDSLVGEDGLIEIKCLASDNHLDILESGEIPEEHVPQLLAEMACAERQWADFIAFDPRFPPEHRLFIKRLHRNEELDHIIGMMEDEVRSFLAEVDAKLKALTKSVPIQQNEVASYSSIVP
jgi:YqaJ-like viral recombinase domain